MGGLLNVDGCGCYCVERAMEKGNVESYGVEDEKPMWIIIEKGGAEGCGISG